MSAIYKEAGKRIYDLRSKKHFTREQLASASGISTKFLYEIECGRKGFSADTLLCIAEALSVNCNYILTGDDEASVAEEWKTILNHFDVTQQEYFKKLLILILQIQEN